MGFLAPWFLAGAAVVGLPVWLHLLRKHKSTPLPFSSLMFFERHTQSSIRHRRLRYLVLFALRAAFLLLLALAFAQPYLERQGLPVDHSGEVTVLAIDRSLSMGADGRLDRARRMAKAAVARLRTGQRAQVVAFGSKVQAMSEISSDRAALDAAIDAIEISDARTSFAEFSRALRTVAQSSRVPLRVELYSDMQQSGMPANFNDLRWNANIRLEPHPLAPRETPNFAVENVLAPRRVYDGKKTRVLATVAGFGTPAATRQVSLLLNGRVVEAKPVEVPANGRATVEFDSLEVPYGRNRGEVRTDAADALAADDTFYFSVERADPRPVLFVHEMGDERGLLYFKAALEASGHAAFAVESAAPEQTANLSPDRYGFVVLSDAGPLPGAFENRLRDYARNGGGVLVALGRMAAARGRVAVSGDRIVGPNDAASEAESFETAAWLDTSHPSIQQDNRWEGVKFYRTIRVEPGSARVAARLSDGTPLLLDQPLGRGRVLVFASGLDGVANDFPLHAAFVPFIEQTARYLGHTEDGPSSVLVGEFAELRFSQETGTAVDVLNPRGERALSLAEAVRARTIQFTEAGFYEIRRPSGPNDLVAVNADRRESDLTPALPETLALWQNTASGPSGREGTAHGERQKLPLWWYAMWAALALALAESWLGNRHLAADREGV